MTTQQHTPGPWHMMRHGSDGFLWGPEKLKLRGCIAKINLGETSNVSAEQREADAALLIAAPDLLALVKRAEVHLAGLGAAVDLRRELVAAIAKAEGRS